MSRTLATLYCALALIVVAPPARAAETYVDAHVVNIFADPSDLVIEADTAGTCGSKYFHVQRVLTNFKEMTALAFTAFGGAKHMGFYVDSCVNDRNILGHIVAFGS